jgi:PHS family inorganic phosphate transporter-like MFS transporter
MLGIVYWQGPHKGVIPHSAENLIKVAPNVGTVFGMVVFGYLADVVGRKKMYGIELIIIITATLAQSLCSSSPAMGIVGVIVFWRVMMGIGVGGDYPLSAVITSEMADTKWRGAMIGAVFAMQGLGQFAAAMMVLIVTIGFKNTLQAARTPADCNAGCQKHVDMMWRLVLGFGGIPGWFALYYRLTIPETPRYTFDVRHNPARAVADSRRLRSGKKGPARVDDLQEAKMKAEMLKYHAPSPAIKEFYRYFKHRKHFMVLFGTSASWFLLDVAFYGLNLNTSTILGLIGFNSKDSVYVLLYNTAVGQLVLICAGSIPGYWCTVAFADVIGRKPIQVGGFIILTIIFTVIGFKLKTLSEGALLGLYILAQFFFNFGQYDYKNFDYKMLTPITQVQMQLPS